MPGMSLFGKHALLGACTMDVRAYELQAFGCACTRDGVGKRAPASFWAYVHMGHALLSACS